MTANTDSKHDLDRQGETSPSTQGQIDQIQPVPFDATEVPQAPAATFDSVPDITLPVDSDIDIAAAAAADSIIHSAGVPPAVAEAAEQLEIAVPEDKRVTLRAAHDALEAIFTRVTKRKDDRDGMWETIWDIANDLSMVVALDSNCVGLVERSAIKDRDILVVHSINTALIAMDLVKHVETANCTPQEIGAAGLLHDIGLAAMKLDHHGPGKSRKFEQHVNRAMEILDEMKVPATVRTMVEQHHERIDGCGYPNGIKGLDFHICSQVLALSDGFERALCMSLDDTAQDGGEEENYMQATLHHFHNALDSNILKAFISLRGFYPDGVMVELTNRAICLVIKQNEGAPLSPVVQLVMDSAGNHPETPKIIDLRTANALSIVRAIGNSGETGGN